MRFGAVIFVCGYGTSAVRLSRWRDESCQHAQRRRRSLGAGTGRRGLRLPLAHQAVPRTITAKDIVDGPAQDQEPSKFEPSISEHINLGDGLCDDYKKAAEQILYKRLAKLHELDRKN